MRFQVKDREYFLTFVEDERRWYVFSPSNEGLERLPVYVDAAIWEHPTTFQKSAGSAQE